MNPKSKANFINSIAAGQTIPCPRCGAANRPTDAHCIACGAELAAPKTTTNNTPAFASVANAPVGGKTARYVEPVSVFADGLPEWDIVPPQVVVRRR